MDPFVPFLQHLKQWFEKHQIDLEGNRFLIAVSGGPDSVLLVHLMKLLGARIGLAHVNYQLRNEESDMDQALVEEIGKELNCEVHVHAATQKEVKEDPFYSVQEKARDIRYHFFEELMDLHDYSYCLTAHHGDDQVETLLFQLFRGNSVSILKGIPEVREPYLRPLLIFTKEEILQACNEKQIKYRIDHTNLQNDYIRNQIRNKLVPFIREINPSIMRQMSRVYQWYHLQEHFIEYVIERMYPFMVEQNEQGATLDWTAFLEQYPKEFLPVLVSEVLSKWGVHGQGMQQALRLINSTSGKFVEWQSGKIYRTREGIAYSEEDQTNLEAIVVKDLPDTPLSYTWMGREIKLSYHEGEFKFGVENEFYLDSDEIKWPIRIRSWKLGDRMVPFGMNQSKKLSDIFIDNKLNPLEKERAIVIEDQQKIICLSDFRQSDSVKITEDTWHVLKISFREKGE
ncbi:MAG: tRNA lysidine(34) synthetase TilS [Bacteroidia bacterium]|nr:tRNA lysidine(34) synthetase TilS [Bacteroidia bacterium]